MMTEHQESYTDGGTRVVTFTTDAPVTLQFEGRQVDLAVTLDAEPGRGRLEFDSVDDDALERIQTSVREGVVTVRVPQPSADGPGGLLITLGRGTFSFGRSPRVTATASLPPGSGLTVDVGSGDVTVSGPAGRAHVRTGSGDIHLEAAAAVRVESGSGEVTIGRCAGGSLTSGSGNLSLDTVHGAVTLRTGSGEINVGGLSSDLTAGSGSGDIHIERVKRGRVECHTGSGDIEIGVAKGVPVWQDLACGSGAVERGLSRRGEPEPGAPFVSITASATSGNIALMDA